MFLKISFYDMFGKNKQKQETKSEKINKKSLKVGII